MMLTKQSQGTYKATTAALLALQIQSAEFSSMRCLSSPEETSSTLSWSCSDGPRYMESLRILKHHVTAKSHYQGDCKV